MNIPERRCADSRVPSLALIVAGLLCASTAFAAADAAQHEPVTGQMLQGTHTPESPPLQGQDLGGDRTPERDRKSVV